MSIAATSRVHTLVAPAQCDLASLADVTATASAVALSAAACVQVVIKALDSNTTNVRVGDALITTSRGYPLTPGESVTLGVSDVSKVYIIAESGSPVVAVLYVVEDPQ